jgi:hypothetical protein
VLSEAFREGFVAMRLTFSNILDERLDLQVLEVFYISPLRVSAQESPPPEARVSG